jgi:hypothetical protein
MVTRATGDLGRTLLPLGEEEALARVLGGVDFQVDDGTLPRSRADGIDGAGASGLSDLEASKGDARLPVELRGDSTDRGPVTVSLSGSGRALNGPVLRLVGDVGSVPSSAAGSADVLNSERLETPGIPQDTATEYPSTHVGTPLRTLPLPVAAITPQQPDDFNPFDDAEDLEFAAELGIAPVVDDSEELTVTEAGDEDRGSRTAASPLAREEESDATHDAGWNSVEGVTAREESLASAASASPGGADLVESRSLPPDQEQLVQEKAESLPPADFKDPGNSGSRLSTVSSDMSSDVLDESRVDGYLFESPAVSEIPVAAPRARGADLGTDGAMTPASHLEAATTAARRYSSFAAAQAGLPASQPSQGGLSGQSVAGESETVVPEPERDEARVDVEAEPAAPASRDAAGVQQVDSPARPRLNDRFLVILVAVIAAGALGGLKYFHRTGQPPPPSSVSEALPPPAPTGAMGSGATLPLPPMSETSGSAERDSGEPAPGRSGDSGSVVSRSAVVSAATPAGAEAPALNARLAALEQRLSQLENGRAPKLERAISNVAPMMGSAAVKGPVTAVRASVTEPHRKPLELHAGPSRAGVASQEGVNAANAGHSSSGPHANVGHIAPASVRKADKGNSAEASAVSSIRVEYLGTFHNGNQRVGEILVDGKLLRVKEGDTVAGKLHVDSVEEMSVTIAGKSYAP